MDEICLGNNKKIVISARGNWYEGCDCEKCKKVRKSQKGVRVR